MEAFLPSVQRSMFVNSKRYKPVNQPRYPFFFPPLRYLISKTEVVRRLFSVCNVFRAGGRDILQFAFRDGQA